MLRTSVFTFTMVGPSLPVWQDVCMCVSLALCLSADEGAGPNMVHAHLAKQTNELFTWPAQVPLLDNSNPIYSSCCRTNHAICPEVVCVEPLREANIFIVTTRLEACKMDECSSASLSARVAPFPRGPAINWLILRAAANTPTCRQMMARTDLYKKYSLVRSLSGKYRQPEIELDYPSPLAGWMAGWLAGRLAPPPLVLPLCLAEFHFPLKARPPNH